MDVKLLHCFLDVVQRYARVLTFSWMDGGKEVSSKDWREGDKSEIHLVYSIKSLHFSTKCGHFPPIQDCDVLF